MTPLLAHAASTVEESGVRKVLGLISRCVFIFCLGNGGRSRIEPVTSIV